jgi:hypothetical protein
MATWQMPMAYVVPQPWLIHFGHLYNVAMKNDPVLDDLPIKTD